MGKWRGAKGGPKSLLNQGPSEPCYATGRGNHTLQYIQKPPTIRQRKRSTALGCQVDKLQVTRNDGFQLSRGKT